MAEVRSREDKPLPGIEYSEIHIPDEDNLSTGSFLTVTEPKALSKINPIMSAIVNKPFFQLIVNINSAEEAITVLLGEADNSPARSRKVYMLPKDAKLDELLHFNVFFKEWDIKALELDGSALKEKLL